MVKLFHVKHTERGKKVNLYKVTSLSKVDKTRYKEGDIFMTSQSIAILHNGKMETLVKQSDVRKLVRDELKKVTKNEK